MRADERLTRVKRAFQDGEIEASEWREQKAELRDERDAAASQEARLAAELVAARHRASHDLVEDEVVAALSQIRADIASTVASSQGVDAARAAIFQLFSGFVIHRWKPLNAPALAHADEPFLEPLVRDDLLKRLHDARDADDRRKDPYSRFCRGGYPPLRVALQFTHENNELRGFPSFATFSSGSTDA